MSQIIRRGELLCRAHLTFKADLVSGWNFSTVWEFVCSSNFQCYQQLSPHKLMGSDRKTSGSVDGVCVSAFPRGFSCQSHQFRVLQDYFLKKNYLLWHHFLYSQVVFKQFYACVQNTSGSLPNQCSLLWGVMNLIQCLSTSRSLSQPCFISKSNNTKRTNPENSCRESGNFYSLLSSI